jgi:hypothetical protein
VEASELIYPTAIKSYRYKDGVSYSFGVSDGSTLILDGPLVVKSISLSIRATSVGAATGFLTIQDGTTDLFNIGQFSYVSYYPSVYRVNLPGAGIRLGTSLRMEITGLSTTVCTNINIGYQR